MIDFRSARETRASAFDFIRVRIASPEEIRGPKDSKERERLELTAEAHEPIVGIEVREGERVAAGARLLELSLGAMQPRLDQASARVAQ